MNWGYRLVILFAGFAALMITLVYKATHTKFELVSKDYYSEELRYQEKIDGMNNAAVAGEMEVHKDSGVISLLLPSSLHGGTDSANAWFYCQQDATRDRKMRLHFSGGKITLPVADFKAANYELKLQVYAAGKLYYYKHYLSIP